MTEDVFDYIKKIEDACPMGASDAGFDIALIALAAKRFVNNSSTFESLKEQFVYNADFYRDYVVTFAGKKFGEINEDDFPDLLGYVLEAAGE